MGLPPTDREKFDTLMYQRFKENAPKQDSAGKTILQFLVFFLVMAVLYLIFGH